MELHQVPFWSASKAAFLKQMIKEGLFAHHGPCRLDLTIHFDGRGELDVFPQADLAVALS